MRVSVWIVLALAAAWNAVALGDDSASAPRRVPLTRPQMKQALEDLKSIKPRIPLPELTEEEKANLDERGMSYEGRLRSLYAPGTGSSGRTGSGGSGSGGSGSGGRLGGNSDPKMTLDYAFKTELFWIVSRANNCHY